MALGPGNVNSYNTSGYVLPGEDVRRKIAMQLLMQGTSGEPVQAWTQGGARIAQALLGGYELYNADKQDLTAKKLDEDALYGGGPKPPGVPGQPPGPRPVADALAGPPPAPAPPAPPPQPAGPAPGSPAGTVADRFSPVYPAIADGTMDPRGNNNIPNPVKTVPVPPPQAAPAIDFSKTEARIAELRRGGPESHAAAAQLQIKMDQAKLAQSLPDYDIKPRDDGAFTIINKNNPNDVRVVKPQGAAQDIATFQGEVAKEKTKGEGQGAAALATPGAEINLTNAIDVIDKIKKHPGTQWSIGSLGWVPPVPGTEQAGAVALIDQLKGQTFAQAFGALKGGGQVTEVEGVKATNALGRLQRAQNPKDFNAALDDLKGALASGVEKLKRQSSGQFNSPAQPSVRKYNPASGKIE